MSVRKGMKESLQKREGGEKLLSFPSGASFFAASSRWKKKTEKSKKRERVWRELWLPLPPDPSLPRSSYRPPFP